MSLPDGPAPPPEPSTTPVRRDASPAIATAAAGTLPARPAAERCDHCSAPVEASQRYCVQCGAHQRRADDPTARWFASARRAKAAPAALPAAGQADRRTVSSGVAALLIALLPVSAGIGVLVGRGSDDSGQAVVEALKAVGGGGGGLAAGAAAVSATTPDGSGSAADDGAADDGEEAKTTKKVDGVEVTDKAAPIIASGPTGSARKLTGTKPTEKDVQESKKALETIESNKGEDYVEQQKNLPDTIVIP